MSYYPVTGTKIYVGTVLQAAKTVTIMTNAAPPLATSVGHGYTDNDEVLMVSGWEDVNSSVFRVDQQSADTFLLLGLDATNTTWYPAGSGIGTAEKVTTWLEVGQVLDVSSDGGGVKNITVAPIDRRNEINIPTGFAASTLNLTLGYDPARADQIALLSASRALAKRPIKFALPGSGFAYAYGTVAMSNLPTFETSSVMKISVSIGIEGLFTKY